MENFFSFFNKVDEYMYYPVLIVILAAGGLFLPSVQGSFSSGFSARLAGS